MGDLVTPPIDEVFYCSQISGKKGPLYLALGGVRSAFKTSWVGRTARRQDPNWKPRVYRARVEWVEIDLETGLPLYPQLDTAKDRLRRMHQ
jgi:hypothetical protein